MYACHCIYNCTYHYGIKVENNKLNQNAGIMYILLWIRNSNKQIKSYIVSYAIIYDDVCKIKPSNCTHEHSSQANT